ncbi:IS66 family insertion sequence element accessory protein TnpB [Glaciimonas immobilis]|uniref:Transposase n=1 Tax=Glaciimonas immobilis TaxID=728004 RepID=A0A840RY66_9BURK|nr:IS66 family insertion sequence element accessory protein TnpB [Glaciimonas immobilis]KAF3996062.1 IS66 family insertion sequence element accessory protein TnpB [Glaciimonas immobilis]MBB5201806.1 transposase [Glaciimonas immobilis]
MNTELKPGNRKGRPNYPVDFKRRLAAASCETGVSVFKMAMANGVNANMAFKRRREFRAGLCDDVLQTMSPLLPVVLVEASSMISPTLVSAETVPASASDPIEIVFADAVVRVRAGADVALLRTIFQSLRA